MHQKQKNMTLRCGADCPEKELPPLHWRAFRHSETFSRRDLFHVTRRLLYLITNLVLYAITDLDGVIFASPLARACSRASTA